MNMYLCCLSAVHVLIICSSVYECADSIPKPRTQNWGNQAKQWPWEGSEGVFKQPNLQRERHSQPTVNMRMKWTDLHQHQQHASSSSMSVSSDTNIRNKHTILYSSVHTYLTIFNVSRRIKINQINLGRNMRLFFSVVLSQTESSQVR
jgi:hypothetical protein